MRGNTGAGPLKALDEKSLAAGGQRWRFIPLQNRLDSISARPATVPSLQFDTDLDHLHPDDTSVSHFAAALETNSETNVTATFTDYVQQVKPLSHSLPLIYRNRRKLFALTVDALKLSTRSAAEATPAVTKCLTALSKDLGPRQFHPFFPQVIDLFSLVFDMSRHQDNTKRSDVAKACTSSVFWDPELSIVPLFAALAEITKSHLQCLASDPKQTLRELLPLLGHSHYRVREMTAESCLGYLLRKTRDLSVLKQLTRQLLDLSTAAGKTTGKKSTLLDGLGASLFEAVRLPSGRLHARGPEILAFALQRLEEVSPRGTTEFSGIESEFEERILRVISLCLVRLCRHLTNPADIHIIIALFLKTGEDARKQANAAQVGHIAFVSRKWLQRRGSGAVVRDRTTLQKFLSALADWVGHFLFAPRVVYECLGGICSIVSLSSEDNIRQSSRRALCSALAKVSNSTQTESVLCATAVVLNSQVMSSGNLMDVYITQAFGALCDQLAKLSVVDIFATTSIQVSIVALQRVLSFLRRINESGTDSTLLYRNSFRVPTLEVQIKSVLSHSSAAFSKNPHEEPSCSVIRDGLRYLSIVQVDNDTDIFGNLLTSEGLDMDDSGLLLEAFCRQANGRIKDMPPLLTASTSVLVDRLFNSVENSVSSTVMTALNKYIRLFPVDSKKRFSLQPQALERYGARLSENLSSLHSGVRLHSAELLSSISGLISSSESVSERTDSDEVHGSDALQSRIEVLRSSFSAYDACLLGFFESLRYVCDAVRSLSRIDDALRVLREVARLLRNSENVSRVAVIASIHFSIGLLRTPFKTLWNTARDIWSAAAGHLSEEATTLMILQVSTAESRLVSACSANREEPADAGEDRLGCVSEKKSLQKGDDVCGTKDKYGITTFGQGSLSYRPCVKRRRTDENSPKTEPVTVHVSKRQKADGREASLQQWDWNEWMQHCADSGDCGIAAERSKNMGSVAMIMDSFTDDLTFLQEVLRTLTNEPQHAVAVRSQLISSYLRLDPSLFSRRMGNSLATSFAVLLEKMGGLKRWDEDSLEQSLRCRLLSDLTRSCPALQAISLKCLCAAPCGSLKRHCDSFIRLLDDASFRDELTALAETLLPSLSLSENGDVLDNDSDFTLDVLMRICFSKMTGKVDRTDSRRSAVLCFVVSTLPVGIALPKIIRLVLSPIEDIVDEVEVSVREHDPVVDGRRFPGLNVQLGLLSSIESIMKHCHRSLASSSWCRIAVGSFVLLRNASTGSAGKHLRSRSLRILADMFRARGEETSFLVLPVLRAMRGANFEVDGRTAGHGVPGLLHFMSSVYSANLAAAQKSIVLQELWAVRWSLHPLKNENAELETVKVSLGVAQGLVALILASSMTSTEQTDVLLQDSSTYESICSMLLWSLRALLCRLVEDVLRDRSRRKAWGPVFDSALEILERLVEAPSLKSEDLVGLCDGLVVYLENTVSFSGSCERTLKVLTAMSEQLCERKRLEDKQNSKDHMRQVRRSVLRLLPLLANVKFINDSKCYFQLCGLLGSLDAPDLKAVSAPLQAMNAMKSSQLDSPDLDRRVDGLNCVIKSFKDALEEPRDCENYGIKEVLFSLDGDSSFESRRIICHADGITALVYGCIASVMFDDVAVRGTSSYALQLIGKWSTASDSESAKTCHQRMFKLLLEAVVSARNGIVRREYTRGLAELVRRSEYIRETKEWSGYSAFSLLKDMSKPNDLDSDFFENVVHLQAHRRSRALRQIQKEVLNADQRMVMDDEMKYEAYTSFASIFSLPLGLQIALELSDDDERRIVGSRHAESRESAAKDVAVWAVAVVGASARWLRWSELKSCICDLLRKLKHCVSEKRSLTLYKLLVAVVEAFPQLPNAQEGPDSPIKEFLVETLLPTMLNHISAGGVEGDVVLNVTEAVTSTKGEHQRGRSAPGIFRAPVAIAVAHLVTRLTDSDVDAVIPRLVTPLANALRSRKTAVRDSAKKALTSVVLTLGSSYLPYVLNQVLSALGQGFRKDACVYVIHSLLRGIRESARKVSTGGSSDILSVDEAAGMIAIHLSEELERGTSVIINDFEDPNASSFFKKQASLRAARAFDCAEMLAEYVTFDTSARIVLQPFQKILARTSSVKLVSRVENILHRIVTGFTKNCSMRPGDALKLCYELIAAPSGFDTGESVESMEKDGVVCFPGRDVLKTTTMNGYSIIIFGLQLLCNVVNRNAMLLRDTSCESRELQAMLGPFLPLIAQALQTKHNSLTVAALRATQKLLKLPVSNKAFTGEIMSKRIVDVLSQNAGLVTHGDDLFNSCLRAASVLIYEVGDSGFRTLSKERVEALTSISCKCMESGGLETRSAALALLKAVVSSRIMIPAVYDAIERVNEMAIHSQSSSFRLSCTALSVQFAVSFPLGSRRVRQHLEFFVRNLNYELSSGRLAALEVIKAIILKFPAEVLEEECQYLFVALAASVARDSDPECRHCSSHALQLLFERVPIGRHVTSMLKMASLLTGVMSDMTSLDEEMKTTSSVDDDVQLSGAFALTTACKSGRLSAVQLHLIARVLVTALTGRRDTAPWETTYSLLHGLEIAFDVQKVAAKSERLEMERHTRVFWEAMPSLLLHQHPWIRLSSARLLGSHLSVGGDQNLLSQARPDVQFSLLWDSSGLARATLKSCCAQLEALGLSEDLGQQCLKNLLCMANVIFKNPAVGDLASEEDPLEDRKDDANTKASVSYTSQSKNRGLNWLLFRMSGLALRAGGKAADLLRRGCALRFLLVTTQWWGFDFVNLYKKVYIAPVVKALEQPVSANMFPEPEMGRESSAKTDDQGIGMLGLKEIARTLQDVLVEGLGATAYYEVYQALRSERDDAKQTRKRQVAFELAVNPERAAKRRRKKAESRRNKRGNANVDFRATRENSNTPRNPKNYLTDDL